MIISHFLIVIINLPELNVIHLHITVKNLSFFVSICKGNAD
jgi:hypothetical protein